MVSLKKTGRSIWIAEYLYVCQYAQFYNSCWNFYDQCWSAFWYDQCWRLILNIWKKQVVFRAFAFLLCSLSFPILWEHTVIVPLSSKTFHWFFEESQVLWKIKQGNSECFFQRRLFLLHSFFGAFRIQNSWISIIYYTFHIGFYIFLYLY